ncbi:hypothetical protein QE152_g23625 [Popillia japonica]|uniref:Methyltransferase n=1 Tax=Popillia japonica TaxID=7064 RepID=A0AAW1KGD7_POPJA
MIDIMDSKTTKDMKNQYDHIFASCMDHLILDTRSLVSTLHAFLKPEGQLFIITLPDNFFKRGLDKQFQNEKWIKYKPKQPLFTEYTKNPIQYLTTILQNTGFEVNKCEYDNQFYTTNDLEGFTRALIDMYLQLELLSADLLDDFSADLVQECKKQCKLIAEPNKYDIPINVVTWIATKTT